MCLVLPIVFYRITRNRKKSTYTLNPGYKLIYQWSERVGILNMNISQHIFNKKPWNFSTNAITSKVFQEVEFYKLQLAQKNSLLASGDKEYM